MAGSLTAAQIADAAQKFDQMMTGFGPGGGGPPTQGMFTGDTVIGSVSNADMQTSITQVDVYLNNALSNPSAASVLAYLVSNVAASMTGMTTAEKNMLIALVCLKRAGAL